MVRFYSILSRQIATVSCRK